MVCKQQALGLLEAILVAGIFGNWGDINGMVVDKEDRKARRRCPIYIYMYRYRYRYRYILIYGI